MNWEELIILCRQNDRRGQAEVFSRLSPMVLGICRRYLSHIHLAEESMIIAMHKILTKLDQYSGNGSFEGWARRIAVNECLMQLRKNKERAVDLDDIQIGVEAKAPEALAENDLLKLIAYLPEGYRVVFNLYVIEGYKHREIAELLEVSINTSKSQLLAAKKRMQELIALHYPQYLNESNKQTL